MTIGQARRVKYGNLCFGGNGRVRKIGIAERKARIAAPSKTYSGDLFHLPPAKRKKIVNIDSQMTIVQISRNGRLE
jgi:hypothetical protein